VPQRQPRTVGAAARFVHDDLEQLDGLEMLDHLERGAADRLLMGIVPPQTFYGKLPVSSLNIRRTVVSRCAAKFGIFSYCWSFTASTA
jgi:hypothetical protein